MATNYYSTFIIQNAYSKQEQLLDDMEYMLSGATKGLSEVKKYPITKTVLSESRSSYPIDSKYPIYNLLTTSQETSYTTFKIPKRTGGYRTILAPNDGLLAEQKLIVEYLRKQLKILEHNSAHAYIPERSIVTNAKMHQNSNHFINIDLSNFFPSITREIIEVVFEQLAGTKDLFLDSLIGVPMDKEHFFNAILYKGALPQGSAASPYISNLIMIPFDHWMKTLLKEKRRDIIYTRYADDMTFSSKLNIHTDLILEIVEEAKRLAYQDFLTKEQYANFIVINKKKTRKTTKNGKNRVTGIKINSKNNLSIGYKEKQMLKQNLARLIISKKYNNEVLNQEEVDATIGMLSYLKGVEPSYAQYLTSTLCRKFEIRNLTKFLTEQ